MLLATRHAPQRARVDLFFARIAASLRRPEDMFLRDASRRER